MKHPKPIKLSYFRRVEKQCQHCGEKYFVKPSRESKSTFCSWLCRMNHPRSDETRKKLSLAQKGKHNSPSTEFKKGNVTKRKSWPRNEEHSNWKGGIIPLTIRMRKWKEYKVWKGKVFARDGFSCVECGVLDRSTTPKIIQAHHITSVSDDPRQMFSIENGVTLCLNCHAKTPNFRKSKRHRVIPACNVDERMLE